MTRERAILPLAVGGLIICGLLFRLAWHNGVGLCNVATPDNGTSNLLYATAAIAIANLAFCVAAWWRRRGTNAEPWLLAVGSICAVITAATVALFLGANFRGC
jgi:hypothetical protein